MTDYEANVEYLQHKIKSYKDRLALAHENHIVNEAQKELRALVGDASAGDLVQLPYQAVCDLLNRVALEASKPPLDLQGTDDPVDPTVILNGVTTKVPSATLSFEQISALAERYPGEHLTIVYHHKGGASGSLIPGQFVTVRPTTTISAYNTGSA